MLRPRFAAGLHHLLPVALLLAAAPALAGGGEGATAPAADPAPATDPAEEPYLARVTGDKVHVRAGPSLNDPALEQLPRGSWVVVTGAMTDGGGSEGDAWFRVRVPGGVPVFVHGSLVDVAEPADPSDEAATARRTGTVNATDVVLRPTAGKEFPPVRDAKLQRGAVVRILATGQGADGAWLRVLPPEGFEAFMHGRYLERIGSPDERAAELARITLERRDGYTGDDEAARAAAKEREREEALEALVVAAVGALETTPAEELPADTKTHLAALERVMTESGIPELRLRANLVARDFADRARRVEIARARAERDQVKEELEARLAAIERKHAEEVERLRAAEASSGGEETRTWMAVGTLRRTRAGYELVKGGVVLHRVDSLRYDLSEMVGLRMGVDGRRVTVDAEAGLVLLRIDELEILE